MADYKALATTLVDPIYKPMEESVNSQIAEAQNDPYYQSLLSGLETAKNKSFSEIEGRAAGRGVAYGNIPSQQQAVYTGEKYLPAVAEVKKSQLDRINALKQTLAELRSKRASSILDYSTKLEDRDYTRAMQLEERNYQRALDAQKLAASRSSSSPRAYYTSKGSGGGTGTSYATESDLTNDINAKLENALSWGKQNKVNQPFYREQAAEALASQYPGYRNYIFKTMYQTFPDNWANGN